MFRACSRSASDSSFSSRLVGQGPVALPCAAIPTVRIPLRVARRSGNAPSRSAWGPGEGSCGTSDYGRARVEHRAGARGNPRRCVTISRGRVSRHRSRYHCWRSAWRCRPLRDCWYRRPAASMDSRRARALQSGPQYRCPRSQGEQMLTSRSHLAHSNTRASAMVSSCRGQFESRGCSCSQARPHPGTTRRMKTSLESRQGTRCAPLNGARASNHLEREHQAARHSENPHHTRRDRRRRGGHRIGSGVPVLRDPLLKTLSRGCRITGSCPAAIPHNGRRDLMPERQCRPVSS